MRRVLAWAVAAALMGCGAPVARTPDQVACESRANDDPAVKLLIMKGAGVTQFQEDHQQQLRDARATSIKACLQQRGVIAPGGVERQKPL